MVAIGIKTSLKRKLSNLVSAYDSYTAGMLIAGVIMIVLEILRSAQ
ncbi:MAG: hypothetical protein WED05_11830 [Candidatus Atabeyarchaeum deiterrae]